MSGAHHRLIGGSWWEPAAIDRRDTKLVVLFSETVFAVSGLRPVLGIPHYRAFLKTFIPSQCVTPELRRETNRSLI